MPLLTQPLAVECRNPHIPSLTSPTLYSPILGNWYWHPVFHHRRHTGGRTLHHLTLPMHPQPATTVQSSLPQSMSPWSITCRHSPLFLAACLLAISSSLASIP
ncbi:hypothetical protein PIB30_053642 [Stylosanthes scabra]|uniref:Uncharacterized protein n=1 Tax=Stylosanthes scabra TaxID=79078 RepID=A0ABU6WI51_9FABA|nr:hypothetical protein [Stylosanthes scabra]